MINNDEPLFFRPYLKTVIWGGDKIKDFKSLSTDLSQIGESWEISAVPGHESVVDRGVLEGRTLSSLVDEFGSDFLGSDVVARNGLFFPLLVKFIDARRDLSVQVHPDDALAMARHSSKGKTEMWYIIDSEPGANIYTGLSAPLDPQEYKRRIADNSIMEVVAAHKSAPGQFYFVPAGTIHAIGAGNLLAEVQQASDITYRVYDYGRVDADGKPRELHTELATDAIDYRFPNVISPTAVAFDSSTPKAVSSDYFSTDFLDLKGGEEYRVAPDGRSFFIVIVTKGEMRVSLANGKVLSARQGECFIVPACMSACVLGGDCQALCVSC